MPIGLQMLIPRYIQGQMVLTDNGPFEIQQRAQQGCSCCGWVGDPYLIVRALPAKYGRGFAVLYKEPNTPACIIYRTDQQQPLDPNVIDHRAITYLAEARKNYELGSKITQMMEAHDAKVQRDIDNQEIALSIELSQVVGRKLRKEGLVSKPHKIDRKKK